MPYYELLCLASGKLGRAELSSLIRKTCRVFLDNGATMSRIVPLGATGHGPRELAYRIRRNQVTYKTGFYINFCAFASPETLAEVNRVLKIDERILRHLAIRKPVMEAIMPIPDVDDVPRMKQELDPNDPEYAMRKFMLEYEQEFPSGSMTLKERSDGFGSAAVEGDGGKISETDAKAVDEVLASLKASSMGKKNMKDSGLAWLAAFEKDLPEKSPPPSEQ